MDSGKSIGVGGHSGFDGSSIGVEMVGRLSRDEPRDERNDGPLALIDSVSLDHEKEREPLMPCAFFSGEAGGVRSPMGMSGSTSLRERLSLRIVSFSSMAARSRRGRCYRRMVARAKRRRTHKGTLHLLCARQVKAAHGSRRRVRCGVHSSMRIHRLHRFCMHKRRAYNALTGRQLSGTVKRHYNYTRQVNRTRANRCSRGGPRRTSVDMRNMRQGLQVPSSPPCADRAGAAATVESGNRAPQPLYLTSSAPPRAPGQLS
jgi:hypothetical protein